jgi:hypothetical protein
MDRRTLDAQQAVAGKRAAQKAGYEQSVTKVPPLPSTGR